MAEITCTWNGIKELEALLDKAGLAAPYAIAKALDEVGNKARTQVIRATAKQAGVPYGAVKQVIITRQAMGNGMGSYVIIARDVTLSLRQFGAVQRGAGVSAAPWGVRRIFKHTFLGLNGQVFVRRGKSRLPIKKLWGPNIPKEMVKETAEKVFYQITMDLLPFTLEKWLLK
ncbi:MAG: hypothetical protein JWM36_3198 [Hyphomicrobiales bacterium]|nr:hypothetical protein [Hyphomicrobiales bacterium]